MKKLLSILFACVTIAACGGATEPDEGRPEDPAYHSFRDVNNTSASAGNMTDNGGLVLPTSNTYAIWWGNQSAFPMDAKAGIDAFFAGLNGSSFLNVSAQYMRGNPVQTIFHTNWTDTSTPPRSPPSTSTIGNEVCRMILQNKEVPDSSAIYFVYTSNFPHVNYCAWHSWGKCNGTPIQIAYMPNTTGIAGCDPGNYYNCNSYSQGTRSLANVTSHEFMEAITDPQLNAWYDNSGAEIGDKCAWTFSSCVQLTNGSWQLQREWSNAVNGCVQQ